MDCHRRTQRLTMLTRSIAKVGGDALPFKDHIKLHVQDFFEDKAQPLGVNGRVRSATTLVVGPLFVGQTQAAAHLALVVFFVQAVGENL